MLSVKIEMKYAEVILPLPLENTYTYGIPDEIEPFVRNYCLVTAPLGKNRSYVAIVKEIFDHPPDPLIEYKALSAIITSTPVIYPLQMHFWEWIASYYLCKTGEVYKAAMPPGLISNENTKRVIPKKETCIRLTAVCNDEEVLNALLGSLKRAKQQERLLLAYVELSMPFQPELTHELTKKELLKASGIHVSILDGLIKRGILESYEKESDRIQLPDYTIFALNVLTEPQQMAYERIQNAFKTKAVCLLFGVTSCGKTEIYTHLIQDTLLKGFNVLYLLPEIAVTEKMTARMKRIFGDRLLVYHSGISDHDRVRVWNCLLHAKDAMFVIGVRSSVFLPFPNLGLVIVDDEHDASYRQNDPAPRFHARNAAIMLAHFHSALTLLGSATPSLETYYNAKTGKYGFVGLSVRYENNQDPLVRIADVKDLKRRKIMKESLFSPILKEKMEEALKHDGQIVVFQNRRGFAVVTECKSCGYVVRCPDCDVSLTVHKKANRLICHYCGHSVVIPSSCPSCGEKEVKLAGFGTEKVEEEIATLFPGVSANRLDFDTARTRSAFQHILKCFEQGKSQILIGTQMLAKSLDIKNVGVVGILNVDNLMNIPDFRSHERAFQMLVQLSGLACRNHNQGTVVIQTTQPDHPLIRAIQSFDYGRMAGEQLIERKLFRYPPYYRLIVLVFRCSNEQILELFTTRYAALLFEELGDSVLPPFTPPVNRVQTLVVRHIMLKTETSLPVPQVRTVLDKVNRQMRSFPGFSKVVLHYEVDN